MFRALCVAPAALRSESRGHEPEGRYGIPRANSQRKFVRAIG